MDLPRATKRKIIGVNGSIKGMNGINALLQERNKHKKRSCSFATEPFQSY